MAETYRWLKRAAITVAGFTVLLLGIAMIVLPGPAVLVIPAGLGILALEFGWARRLLQEARARVRRYSPIGRSKMRSRT
jgi:tellurite resistance protein TerC